MENKSMTVVGLVLSIIGYPLILLMQSRSFLADALSEEMLTVLGLGLVWVMVILLLLIIGKGEKRTLASIGCQKITVKDTLLAIVIGIVLSLAVPLLTLLANQIWPQNAAGGDIAGLTTQVSWGVIFLSVLTAGICEEIVFRGYLIERIRAWTGQAWVAMLVSLVAFVLPHTVSWNLIHVIAVVMPLGLILSGLYLWKRNLYFNMVVHVVIDLPLVFMALSAR